MDDKQKDELEFAHDFGAIQARRACIERARAVAANLTGEANQALSMLADEFEAEINPRDGLIDGVYGAYLDNYRIAITGGPFLPGHGVQHQAAALIGACDGKAQSTIGPRPRHILYEEVVRLVGRR